MERALCCVLVLFVVSAARAAERPPFFPFVFEWNDGSPGPTSLADWNETPAGAKGHVVVRDGHFYVGDERIRFWGTNVSFAGGTPEKPVAEAVARRMAKFGINIVRFHHLDNRSPRGILAAGTPDTRSLDPEQLDRMDYFVSQLKAQGIYANLNLHVSHKRTGADGVRDAQFLPQFDKYVSIFDPTLRRLMKEYARDLLTHVNRYTGRAYTEEPAVAMVEITNENSLLAGWLRGQIDDLPTFYADELRGLWNDWLRRRYRSTAELERAWSEGIEPLGQEMLRAGDFGGDAEKHWQLEQHQGAELQVAQRPGRPGEPASVELRVVRTSPEKADWHLQFKQVGLKLEEGRIYTLSFRARADRERPLSVGVMQNHEPWQTLGLRQRVVLGADWEEYRFSFRAAQAETEDGRLGFSLGSAVGTIWLAQVSLRPGMEVLGEGELLERGTVQPAERSSALATPRRTDYVRFLNDVERDFFREMRDHIKKELGCKAPVTGTIGYGLPGVAVQAEMDFVDAHAYWQHPRFPNQPWSRTDWYVPNRAMVDSPEESTLVRLALGRVAGKPFTVTEYNHPAPNEFRAEGIPLVAAYGALQDWDAIFLYSYHHQTGEWDRRQIASYFDIDSDPGKMVQMPVGAAIFRRADVSPARRDITYRLSRDAACVATAEEGLWPVDRLRSAGHHPCLPLLGRIRLTFDERAATISSGGAPVSPGSPYMSDTGELRWEVDQERGGVVTVDTPRTKAVVGRLGGRTVKLEGLTVTMPETDTNFAAITLTAMDGKPLAESSCILITAVGRVENTGMGWNADHTSVSDQWGSAPTITEGVEAEIVLASKMRQARLQPLDSRGQPREGQLLQLRDGALTLILGPDFETLWYLVSPL